MVAEIKIPKILDIPEKLRPMLLGLDSVRYILAEGGRGGGKTQAIARFILTLLARYNLRTVCGRETQNSIAESVYSVFVDLIRQNQLAFEIFATKILHKGTGSQISFRGFREQGAFNIQGMEGVDLLWIDESQAITKQTLDVLIPTIRKENAKIFFSMNRYVEDDPVYTFCQDRSDCMHININYNDNPFCTNALVKEAEECKKKSLDDYNHIWLGEPLSKGDDMVFARCDLLAAKDSPYTLRSGYGLRIAGYDIARFGDDKCACVILQQMGALHWEEVFVDSWGKQDLNYTTGRILQTSTEKDVTRSAIDVDGMGAGPFDTLNKGRQLDCFEPFSNVPISHKTDKEFVNLRSKFAFKLLEMVQQRHIRILDKEVIDELCTLRYTYDHYQRKLLIPKDVMKVKYKVKSPNKADAVIYAVSLIGTVQDQQDNQYVNRPQYSVETDLYELAGIR